MAISGIAPSAALSVSSTPTSTPSVAQSGFSRDVASLQKELMQLTGASGAGKASGAGSCSKSANQASNPSQATDPSQAGGADSSMQGIGKLLQQVVQLLQSLLSKLQGNQSQTPGQTATPGQSQTPGQDTTPGGIISPDLAPSGNPISDNNQGFALSSVDPEALGGAIASLNA